MRPHKWSNNHSVRHFLTYVRNALTYINKTYHSFSLPSLHYDNYWHFQGHRFKGQSHRQHLPECILRRRHADRLFAVEDYLVTLCLSVGVNINKSVIIGNVNFTGAIGTVSTDL